MRAGGAIVPAGGPIGRIGAIDRGDGAGGAVIPVPGYDPLDRGTAYGMPPRGAAPGDAIRPPERGDGLPEAWYGADGPRYCGGGAGIPGRGDPVAPGRPRGTATPARSYAFAG